MLIFEDILFIFTVIQDRENNCFRIRMYEALTLVKETERAATSTPHAAVYPVAAERFHRMVIITIVM